MKRLVVLFLCFALAVLGSGAAYASARAEDAMMVYVGTDAFTKLTASERQACVEWLTVGGAMGQECRKAAMRLVALAPGAVSVEQRRALASAASYSGAVPAPAGTYPDGIGSVGAPVIVEQKDDGAAVIAGGLIGLIAGLVIANNTGHHHRHYAPAPPRHGLPPFMRGPRRPAWKHGGKPAFPPHRRVPVHVPKCPSRRGGPGGRKPPRR